MRTVVLATALAVLACLPAAAQGTSMPGATARCLHVDNISTWKALDNKTLLVEDTYHNRFRVGLMAYCEGLQFKERVGFQPAAPVHLTCLSSGDDVIVRQLGATGFARCPIAGITPVGVATGAMQ